MANIKDVASLANTSISTVSNVMTKKKVVSSELERRVWNAIHKLDYKINPIASSMRSKRSNTIGVIITSFQHVFFAQVLKGIQDIVSPHGYMVNVFDSHNSFEKERYYMEHFANSMIDGVIMASVSSHKNSNYSEYVNTLENLGLPRKKIPIISLEHLIIGTSSIDTVMSDNYLAAVEIVEHLIEMGHKNIAHISGLLKMSMCENRLDGYKNTLKKYNIPYKKEWIAYGDFSPMSGYVCAREILHKSPEITALFAANDQMAIGAIKAIKEQGLAVPENIAVVGFDNIFLSTLINPPLTTVHVFTYQIGVLAAKQLLKRINGETVGDGVTIPLKTQLIIRKSTDPKAESSWDLSYW